MNKTFKLTMITFTNHIAMGQPLFSVSGFVVVVVLNLGTGSAARLRLKASGRAMEAVRAVFVSRVT